MMLLLTSSLIVAYSYYRNYKSIVTLSESKLKAVSDNFINNFNGVRIRSVLIGELLKAAISYRLEQKVIQDPFVRKYLIKAVQLDPIVAGVVIVLKNGNYISAIDLLELNFFHYFSQDKPLPTGAIYALRTIDATATPQSENWEYLDSNENILGKQKVEPISFVAKDQFWFKKMEVWPKEIWSMASLPKSIYPIKESVKTISFGMPLFEKEAFFGMVEINLSMNSLANFIYEYRISDHGRSFILNSDGEILIPNAEGLDPIAEKMAHSVVTDAYQRFIGSKKNYMEIVSDKTKYLVYIEQFPISLGAPWYFVITVPFDDFFGSFIKNLNQLAFISLLIFLLFGFLIYLFSKHISKPIVEMADELDHIRHLDYEKKFHIHSNIEEIVTLENSITALQNAVRSFGKYIPKEIVKKLIGQGKEITLGGKRKHISLMFSDIKDFTTTSESFPVETLLFSLEKYYEVLSDIIIEKEGTIDKFIGDSIMAFWNAPEAIPEHPKKACLAVLKCHKACNVDYRKNQLFDWTTRFGLHAGEVIVGNIGTFERMNYTIVGDVVNAASRVTSLNKEYHTSIIITDAIKKEAGDEFITRPLDFIAVRGKTIKLLIYELVGTVDGELQATPEQVKLCQEFTKAYNLFTNDKMAEAKKLFQEIAKQFPNDTPTKIYLSRIAEAEKK